MKNLLGNEKFWIAVFDMVITVSLFFVGKYLGESALEDLGIVIVAIQPVFVILIAYMSSTEAKIKIALIEHDVEYRAVLRNRE